MADFPPFDPVVASAFLADGWSQLEVAQHFGITRRNLSAMLRQARTAAAITRPARSRQARLLPFNFVEAVRLYEQGHTFAEIGQRFGVSPSTARDRLHELPGFRSRTRSQAKSCTDSRSAFSRDREARRVARALAQSELARIRADLERQRAEQERILVE